ncbi:Long tail fiber protein [Trichinella spiralis]|uniref:Long tail fiber protein n=1 Tax=Trichinella spiralis TaxID=6334 RepID=A0ABR3KLZ3_TRISP
MLECVYLFFEKEDEKENSLIFYSWFLRATTNGRIMHATTQGIGTTTVYKFLNSTRNYSSLLLSLLFCTHLICLVVHVHDNQYYNTFIFHFSFLRYF